MVQIKYRLRMIYKIFRPRQIRNILQIPKTKENIKIHLTLESNKNNIKIITGMHCSI